MAIKNEIQVTLDGQLAEVLSGRRGFISIPGFARDQLPKEDVAGRADLRLAVRHYVKRLGTFHIETHGKYGFCIYRQSDAA